MDPDGCDIWQRYFNDLNTGGPLLCSSFGDTFADSPLSMETTNYLDCDDQKLGPSSSSMATDETNRIVQQMNETSPTLTPTDPNGGSTNHFQNNNGNNSIIGNASKIPILAKRYPENSAGILGYNDLELATLNNNGKFVEFRPYPNGFIASSSPSSSSRTKDDYPMHSDSTSPSISLTSLTTTTNSPLSGPTTQVRRDAHMASEQRRRAIMKNCFDQLQQLLPPSEYRKPSKANLLQAAVNYIVHLKKAEAQLRGRVQKLSIENVVLVQQLQGSQSKIHNNDIMEWSKCDGQPLIAPAPEKTSKLKDNMKPSKSSL